MVNSPVIPDSELVWLLLYSIAKSRFPGAHDATNQRFALAQSGSGYRDRRLLETITMITVTVSNVGEKGTTKNTARRSS
jgi:hypothetical protein